MPSSLHSSSSNQTARHWCLAATMIAEGTERRPFDHVRHDRRILHGATYTLAADNTFVVTHDQLGLKLAHRINRHAHDNQERRRAQADLYTGDRLGQER